MKYKIIGNNKIDIVIEMGFGACITEWIPIAEKLENEHTILLYERESFDDDTIITQETPYIVAEKLFTLLSALKHKKN